MLSSISGVSRSYLTRKAHQLGFTPADGDKHILLTLVKSHKLLKEVGKAHVTQDTAPYVLSFVNCFPNTYKTSLVINFAHYLRIRGYKVLCLDLDNKASMSEYFLGDETLTQMNKDKSVAKFLTDEGADIKDLIIKSTHSGVNIVPSCYQVFTEELNFAKKLVLNPGLEYWRILKDQFEQLTEYDVVLVDTASVFNYLTVSAITESSEVIIPGRFSVSSAQKIKRQIGLIKGFYEDEPTAEKASFSLKLCLTDEKVSKIADKDQMKKFVEKYGPSILKNKMPYSDQIKLADSNGHSMFEEEALAHSHKIKKTRNSVLPVFEELCTHIDKNIKYQEYLKEQKKAIMEPIKAVF